MADILVTSNDQTVNKLITIDSMAFDAYTDLEDLSKAIIEALALAIDHDKTTSTRPKLHLVGGGLTYKAKKGGHTHKH